MMSSECVVTEPLTTILGLSRVFCSAPINLIPITKGNCLRIPKAKYRISMSTPRRVCSCIIVTVLMVTIYIRTIFNVGFKIRQQMFTRSVFSQFLLAAQIISNSSIWLMAAFNGYNKIKNFISYMETLQSLNREMESNWMNIKFKKYKILSWGSILFPMANGVLHTYLNMKTMKNKDVKENILILITAIAFAMMQVAAFLLQLQFRFIVSFVNGTLRVLNHNIKSCIFKSNRFCSYNLYLGEIQIQNRNMSRINIRHICSKYIAICKLIRTIDQQEGAFNLVIVAFGIINIMDFLCKSVSIKDDLARFDISATLIFDIMWASFRGTVLFLMMEPCHQTCVEFERMQMNVSQLLSVSNDKKLREELYNFCHQLELKFDKFSPFGIFTFTRELLTQILGALVTLFAILTQFNIKDKLKQ